MSAAGRWTRRIWYFLNRRRFERDLEREMDSHRAMLDDPRRFGNTIRLREQSADVWGWTWVDDLRQDLRYAVRVLHRSPGFAAAAIATLALGIGASTAIFSVAYGVSIRQLPYSEPERLIRVYESNPAEGQLKQNVSEGTFQDWREGAASLEAMALYTDVRPRFLAESNQPVTTMSVSPVFFDLLGIKPFLGRGFKPEKEYGRSSNEAMISYGAWQRLFGGRTDVIGAQIALRGVRNDDIVVIAGVMPAEFRYGQPADMWRPAIHRSPVPRIVRTWRYDHVVARLRQGATIDQARAELHAVAARLASDFPASNQGWTIVQSQMFGPLRFHNWKPHLRRRRRRRINGRHDAGRLRIRPGSVQTRASPHADAALTSNGPVRRSNDWVRL